MHIQYVSKVWNYIIDVKILVLNYTQIYALFWILNPLIYLISMCNVLEMDVSTPHQLFPN